MDKITELPRRDLIEEMKGPVRSGHSVIIDGRVVPNLVMHDMGDEIEFVLDNRLSWSFPRDQANNAASFAFAAMAIGAGFAHPAHDHYTQRPFAREVMHLGELPKQE